MAKRKFVKCQIWEDNYQQAEDHAHRLGWQTSQGVNQVLNMRLKIAEYAIAKGLIDWNNWLALSTAQPGGQAPVPAAAPKIERQQPSIVKSQVQEIEDDGEVFINPKYNPNSSMWQQAG